MLIKLDLLRKYLRSEIFRFRARRSKNYEAYTAYMLNNFCEVAAEIWKLQQKNIYAIGLLYKSRRMRLNISVSICHSCPPLARKAGMTVGHLTAQPSKLYKNQIGFTLVETLIAIALLLAVLVGPITLIAHSLFSTSFSRNNLIANNLAQEGIELIRAVRDNNILCATLGGTMAWDDNPNGPPPKLLSYYELDPTQSIGLTCGTDTISTPMLIKRSLATCNMPLLVDLGGIYNYLVGSPAGFTRCGRVCSPPNSAPCSASADADIPINDQMEIISTVSWVERGASKSITLRDRVYRWK